MCQICLRRTLLVLLLIPLLLGFAGSVAAEDRFAIAADGEQVTAEIAKLAGIAPYFHLYDGSGKLIELLPNPHLDMEYGIGPAAAATLAEKGVTVLVARKTPGPKMEDVLVASGVRIVRRIGTVQDVVDELRE